VTSELAAFLRARLDEEHEVADREHQHWSGSHWDDVAGEADSMLVGMFSPARALADVASKRAILDLHAPTLTARGYEEGLPLRSCPICDPYPPMDEPNPGECATVLLMAHPYESHPDFDPSWTIPAGAQ
jgi:hypothetical protein